MVRHMKIPLLVWCHMTNDVIYPEFDLKISWQTALSNCDSIPTITVIILTTFWWVSNDLVSIKFQSVTKNWNEMKRNWMTVNPCKKQLQRGKKQWNHHVYAEPACKSRWNIPTKQPDLKQKYYPQLVNIHMMSTTKKDNNMSVTRQSL